MKKRILSIVLTFVMVLSLLPTTALAGGAMCACTISHNKGSTSDICDSSAPEVGAGLAGTHVFTVPESSTVSYVDPDDDTGASNFYISVKDFVGNSENAFNWSAVLSDGRELNYTPSGSTLQVECPEVLENQDSYTVTITLELTGTYENEIYIAYGSLDFKIYNEYWVGGTDHITVDKAKDPGDVPITPTFKKFDAANPSGAPVTLTDLTYKSTNSGQVVEKNGAYYLADPAAGTYRVTVSTSQPWIHLLQNYTCTYTVQDSEACDHEDFDLSHYEWRPIFDGTTHQIVCTTCEEPLTDYDLACKMAAMWVENYGLELEDYDPKFFMTKHQYPNNADACTLCGHPKGSSGGEETPGETRTLTLQYPKDLCDLTVTLEDGTTTISDTGSFPLDESGQNWVEIQAENIADGYRIADLTINGESHKDGFIDGGYGFVALSLTEDSTIILTLEPVPASLPAVDSVFISLGDEDDTPINTVTFSDQLDRVYAQVRFGEQVQPDYFAECTWEYSTDNGDTWKEVPRWGTHDNFWADWPWYTDPEENINIDFMTLKNYLLRVKADGKENYSTGTAYSDPITVNPTGGTVECQHPKVETIPGKPASCTQTGLTDGKKCSACGEVLVEQTVLEKLAHTWGEWIVTKQPTGTADGEETRTCSVCKGTETRPVSKLATQTVMFPASKIEKNYGDAEVYNEAKNLTTGGGALTYTSADPTVATVDPASGKVTIKGAGTTTITATAGAVPGKFAVGSASYTLVVKKAALTIKAADVNIAYGESAPTFSWEAVSEFKYQDDETVVSGTATYECAYKACQSVGTYPITVSGLKANNYDVTFDPGILTVEKAREYTLTLDKLEQVTGHTTPVTAEIAPWDKAAVISIEYSKDNGQTWENQVPTETGSYQVRAALTASDNIEADPDKYTIAALIVKPGVTVNTGNGAEYVDVSVNVESKQAEITIPNEDLEQIVSKADGDVSIDLGGVAEVDQLLLPGDLVNELSKADKADSLTVSTEDVSVTLSAPVLDTISEKIANDGKDTIKITLKSVEVNELSAKQQEALNAIPEDAKIVDVSLVVTHADGSTDTFHELGGDVTITVPYEDLPGVIEGQYVVACHVSDNGVVTYMFATCDSESRTITFTSTHFSNYAIFVSEKPAVIVTNGSGSGLYAVGETVTITADSKSGYRFDGWTVTAGNVTLTDADRAETTFVMPGEAVELTATYTKRSSGGGSSSGSGASRYSAAVERSENGAVSVDPKSAKKGDTVTITVKPDAGYTLETLSVIDKNGKELKLAEKNGKYTFTMPASKVSVEATFMEDNTMLNYFVDVPADAYYYEPVLWAVQNGVTSGTTATTFSPDASCTRAQAVTLLWHAAGSPVVDYAMRFTDVPADAYYAEAVRWAVSQGITSGTSATTFSPDAVCTRAQIVTFLYRMHGLDTLNIKGNPFADVAEGSYYYNAVLWAAENAITGGITAETFGPDVICSRAQIVTFLYRHFVK